MQRSVISLGIFLAVVVIVTIYFFSLSGFQMMGFAMDKIATLVVGAAIGSFFHCSVRSFFRNLHDLVTDTEGSEENEMSDGSL